MRKKTHILISREVADHVGLQGIDRFKFILGSVYPDIVPTVFIKPHTWARWARWTSKNIRSSSPFRRGCALHMLCDFYTYLHNASGYLSYQHIKWEADLKNYFRSHGLIWVLDYYNMCRLHDKYLHTAPSVRTDWKFCCMAISSVYK